MKRRLFVLSVLILGTAAAAQSDFERLLKSTPKLTKLSNGALCIPAFVMVSNIYKSNEHKITKSWSYAVNGGMLNTQDYMDAAARNFDLVPRYLRWAVDNKTYQGYTPAGEIMHRKGARQYEVLMVKTNNLTVLCGFEITRLKNIL